MRRALLVLALLAGACGTTRIVSSDPRARLYVDGELRGRGHAEITRRGGPATFAIEARLPDGRRSVTHVSRRFTSTTFVSGLFTYGIGLLAMWELPSEIAVETPGGDPWLAERDELWLDTEVGSE
jgi:hypothetical protein